MPRENDTSMDELDQIHQENREAQALTENEDRGAPETRDRERPAAREPEQREEPAKPKIGTRGDDKRASIYERQRQLRAEQEANPDNPDIPEDFDHNFGGKNVETRKDRLRENLGEEPPAAEDRGVEEPPETREAQRRRIKVYGQEREVTEDELVSLAQIGAASQTQLDDAKRMRAEAQSLLDTLQEHAKSLKTAGANQPDAENPPQGTPENQPDDTELDEIIDQIQVGSPQEAKAALQKYGDRLVNRVSETVGNLDDRIEQTIEQRQQAQHRREEMSRTFTEFAEDFPEYREDPDLQSTLVRKSESFMREQLAKANVADDSIDEFANRHGIAPEHKVVAAYRYVRDELGQALPSNLEVMRESATRIRQAYGIKGDNPPPPREEPGADTRDLSERRERKRSLGTQPRRATAPSAEPQERSREQSRQEAIRMRRQARVR